jgi:serine/threonine protein kinase
MGANPSATVETSRGTFAPMSLQPLTMLGRYELLEQLAEGGMGSVWLARLTGTGGFEKLCIVKTVLPAIAKDQDFVSRFLHEGRVLTQLQHANIAQVFDMGDDGGTLFLALEYVPGVDLARLVDALRAKHEPMSVALAVHVMQQAAEGLAFAHRRAALDGTPLGIVHRDVSPQNIMVSYDGEVKVIDFGIARSEARSRHTAQASVMGKLGYMAPEQARGESVDHRADQYAAGVLLWELLANSTYIRRGTLTEMVVAMANPTVRPLAALRPEVPPALEAVLLRALAVAPDNRYPTTDDFAHALQVQLVALGSLPSNRLVGDYVRSRCAEAFATQQTLLTRVATLHSPAATPLEQTFVKEVGRATPHSVLTAPARPASLATEAQRPTQSPLPTTGELSKAVSPRWLPLAMVAVLGAALLGAGAWYALGRPAHPVTVPNTKVDPPQRALLAPPPPPPPEVAAPPERTNEGTAPADTELGEGTDVVLSARGRLTPPPDNELIVMNTSPVEWTRCVVTLPGKRRGHLARLGREQTANLRTTTFRLDEAAEVVINEARIECTEGTARVKLR